MRLKHEDLFGTLNPMALLPSGDRTRQDLQYALRVLRRSPGFTAVAVLTLALGIGANTAIFSLINSILLRPLNVADPSHLVTVSMLDGQGSGLGLFSYPNYKDFRDKNEVLAGLAAHRFAPMSLSRGDNTERVWGYLVSGNYFDLLGVKASLGRTFSPEEDHTPGAHPVVVLSNGCFERRFGGDPAIVGQTITLNGHQFTVIGIAPEGFTGTERIFTPEIWAPSMMESWIDPGAGGLEQRGSSQWFTVGRLKPGVSTGQAEAALNALAADLERQYPQTNEGMTVKFTPPGLVIPSARTLALSLAGVLMLTVGLVLALACANLAGLLLARATERRKEIAIRLAMGASRGRLVRQLLTESLSLSAAGGALGFLLAFWFVDLVMIFRPALDFAVTVDLKMDWRVLSFTLFISLFTGVLFGLIPALQATRTDLTSSLKDEKSIMGYRRSRLRSGLIVAQVAFSLVLLAAAGLMVRSLQRVQMIGPGFDTENTLIMSVNLTLQGYTEAQGQEFYRQLAARVESLPGVRSASITSFLPLSLHYLGVQVYVEGQTPSRGANIPEAMLGSVGLNYFSTMGISLKAGRDFTAQDEKDAPPVAIINETFARRFWTGQSAIGKRFRIGESQGPLIEVIGVAKDGKYFSLFEEPRPFVYRPMMQGYIGGSNNDGTLIVRTTDDPRKIIAAVRREVQQLDANLPVFDVKTLTEHLRLSLFPLRISTAFLSGFGLLALGLAVIGIYGIMAYLVSHRQREIGIRMALGATVGDVIKMVLVQGLKLIILGVILGLGGALALSRVLASLWSGVSSTDPLTFTVVPLLLTSVALLACYIPARRAGKVDPISALRHE
ncbi:MAG TPA: ABC transporter permease [Blastocatellia bacterium]|nr:ABC transporter permease [Blastocatellia bacterium]